MEYGIGVLLGIVVGGFARWSGFDRDRSFYPTAMIVIAAYYVLFAVMGAPGGTIVMEVAMGLGFSVLAVVGYRYNPLLVSLAIAGHGVFDWLRPGFIENAGVPVWWPGFCGSIDLVLGLWSAVLAVRAGTWRPGDAPPSAARMGADL